MANTKPTIAARVSPSIRDWISKEADSRDRKMSYVIEELLEEGIERREGSDEAEEGAAPAVV